MNKIRIIFLDIVMIIVMVATTMFSTEVVESDPKTILIQIPMELFSPFENDSLNVRDQFDLGVEFFYKGLRYDEKTFNEDIKIVQSRNGIALTFNDGSLPEKLTILSRGISPLYSACTSSQACVAPELDIVCIFPSRHIGKTLGAKSHFRTVCA